MFMDFVNLLKPVSEQIIVLTNGTYFIVEDLDNLMEKQVVIQISVDALDEDYTNKIRGRYKELIETLKYLKTSKYKNVKIAITVNAKNIISCLEVIKFAEENGWDCELSFVELDSDNILALKEDDIGSLNRVIDNKVELEKISKEEAVAKKVYIKCLLESLLKKREIKFSCEVAKSSLCIDVDGSIYCCFHNKHKIGTIERQIDEILEQREKLLKDVNYGECVRLGCI